MHTRVHPEQAHVDLRAFALVRTHIRTCIHHIPPPPNAPRLPPLCPPLQMLSLTEELSELVFGHAVPNMYECWWDTFFLDIFGANLLGCTSAYTPYAPCVPCVPRLPPHRSRARYYNAMRPCCSAPFVGVSSKSLVSGCCAVASEGY